MDADARRSVYCQPLYSARSFAPHLAAAPPAAAHAGENPASDPSSGPDAPAAPDAAAAPSEGHAAGGDEADARRPVVYVRSDAEVSTVRGPGAALDAAVGPNPVARSGSWPDEREAGGAQQADAEATPQRPRPASAPAAVRRSSHQPYWLTCLSCSGTIHVRQGHT